MPTSGSVQKCKTGILSGSAQDIGLIIIIGRNKIYGSKSKCNVLSTRAYLLYILLSTRSLFYMPFAHATLLVKNIEQATKYM